MLKTIMARSQGLQVSLCVMGLCTLSRIVSAGRSFETAPQPITDAQKYSSSYGELFDNNYDSCSPSETDSWEFDKNNGIHKIITVALVTKVMSTTDCCCNRMLSVEVDRTPCLHVETTNSGKPTFFLDIWNCDAGKKTSTFSIKREDCRHFFVLCEIYVYLGQNFCLRPPTEENMILYPQKLWYEKGGVVRFSCKITQGYLFGSREMTCGENGEWLGEAPTCATPRPILHNNALPNLLSDNDYHSCSPLAAEEVWAVSTKKNMHGIIVIAAITKVTSIAVTCCKAMLIVEVDEKPCHRYEAKELGIQGLFSDSFRCEALKETRKISVKREVISFSSSCICDCFEVCEIYIYTRPNSVCTSDFEISNGGLKYSYGTNGSVHGNLVPVYCEKGYRLKGSEHVRCDHGKFVYSGEEPKCDPVTCDRTPPPIENGYWSEWGASKAFFYGNRLTVRCRSGYTFSGRFNFTECKAEGSWSGTDATCLKILCKSRFEIGNGGLNYSNQTTGIGDGDFTRIYCDKGYRLEGSERVRCDHGNFVYVGEDAKCVPASCDPALPPIENGNWSEWDASKTFFYGNRLTVSCRSGYTFAGRINYTECQAEGSWSSANITCLKIQYRTRSNELILPIVVTVTSLVALAVILVLLWLLYFRKKASERSQGEIIEATCSEPFYSECSVDLSKETISHLPSPAVGAFYSVPKDSHYQYADDEGQYHQPYYSSSRGEATGSQNMMASKEADEFIMKDNIVYGQTT